MANRETLNNKSMSSENSPMTIVEALKKALNFMRTPAYLVASISNSESFGYGMLSDLEVKKIITNLDENQDIKRIQNTLEEFNKNIDTYLSPTLLLEYQMALKNYTLLRKKIKSFSVISNIEDRFYSSKSN